MIDKLIHKKIKTFKNLLCGNIFNETEYKILINKIKKQKLQIIKCSKKPFSSKSYYQTPFQPLFTFITGSLPWFQTSWIPQVLPLGSTARLFSKRVGTLSVYQPTPTLNLTQTTRKPTGLGFWKGS